MNAIKSIKAREILASGGAPSLEVDVILDNGAAGSGSVSYGESAGSLEAFVLLDNDVGRYGGKGMLKAVASVNEKLAPRLLGKNASDQRAIDKLMIDADGTENKSNLGANAILGVSMAVARAAAVSEGLELYAYLQKSFNIQKTGDNRRKPRLPKPLAVLIEGGRHADNSTDFQEYILAVNKNQPATENIRMMEEIYQTLKTLLRAEGLSTNVGNEGAFAPAGLKNNEAPVEMIARAIVKAGYEPKADAGIYLDPAASEFYQDGKYFLAAENQILTSEAIIAKYADWLRKYPIIGVEDGLAEFDWENWPKLLAQAGEVKIVADDLTVTNARLWQKAIAAKAANAILIKLNQAGTVTETMDCCLLANRYSLTAIPSHRGGGETNDAFLVDLAVAVGAEWIKVGPTRGERVCKYNRLMKIEEELKHWL